MIVCQVYLRDLMKHDNAQIAMGLVRQHWSIVVQWLKAGKVLQRKVPWCHNAVCGHGGQIHVETYAVIDSPPYKLMLLRHGLTPPILGPQPNIVYRTHFHNTSTLVSHEPLIMKILLPKRVSLTKCSSRSSWYSFNYLPEDCQANEQGCGTCWKTSGWCTICEYSQVHFWLK